MKVRYYVIFFFAFFAGVATSCLGQWEQIPSNISDNLTDIEIGGSTIYVGGLDATFLKSVDGGCTFNSTSSPGTLDISNVSFHDDSTGYCSSVFSFQTPMKTVDGGNSWQVLNNGGMVNRVANDSVVYVFEGGPALMLSDSLTLLAEPNATIWVDTSIATISPFFGDIGSWGWFTASSDRGINIDYGSFPYCLYVFEVTVVNPDTIFFIDGTAQMFFKSFDAGASWSSNPLPDFALVPNGLCFVSGSLGFYAGLAGIHRTFDSGITWNQVTPTGYAGFNDVFFADSLNGMAVGDSGLIMLSTDGGSTWQNQVVPVSLNLNAVNYWDSAYVVVGDSGTILRYGPNLCSPVTSIMSVDRDYLSMAFPNPSKDGVVYFTRIDSEQSELPVEVYDALGKPAVKGYIRCWSITVRVSMCKKLFTDRYVIPYLD